MKRKNFKQCVQSVKSGMEKVMIIRGANKMAVIWMKILISWLMCVLFLCLTTPFLNDDSLLNKICEVIITGSMVL